MTMVAIPANVQRVLPRLQEEYTAREGRPFEHFYCPVLCRDEPTGLCMGHVVPEAYADCCRARVVQRADVDNWYGSMIEADFGTLLVASGAGMDATIGTLGRRVRARVEVDGRVIPHYRYNEGHSLPANHSHILVENADTGTAHHLVLAESPQDVLAAQGGQWGLVVEHDCRASAVVTLIRSAYLTLFYMYGYRWALSASGLSVGHSLLGRFYEENRGRSPGAVRASAAEFFHPFRHMVRPILGGCGAAGMRGTVEDNRAGVCFGSSGRPFALVVCVRIGEERHAVLMPDWSHVDSVVAYHDFLNGDRETLRINNAVYDQGNDRWLVHPETMEAYWPKNDENSTLN
jgi:hypothetical protein